MESLSAPVAENVGGQTFSLVEGYTEDIGNVRMGAMS